MIYSGGLTAWDWRSRLQPGCFRFCQRFWRYRERIDVERQAAATAVQLLSIFYSWQSDLPNSTNRGFIGECLERAIKELKADPKLRVDPCLDRDTQNVPGSPDIASTIFDKIDNCGLFVCDVSIVNPNSSERPTPNPNVLIELGYAVKTLGWNRIVCVCNAAFGQVEKLPFDLRPRRVRSYNLPHGSDKAEQRKLLTGLLEADLRSIFDAILPQQTVATLIPFDSLWTTGRYGEART